MENYDAIIVGSGPNGLAAGIELQRQGLSTLIVEGAQTIGGGLRTQELTLPGFKHDICSAIHPMALASPFFQQLPLADHGLRFVQPIYPAAHPLDHGSAAVLQRDVRQTAIGLGQDQQQYIDLMEPLVGELPNLLQDALGPLRFPSHPSLLLRFGAKGVLPASLLTKFFKDEKLKALWAGMCAHGIQPLENWTTSAIGLMLMAVGHRYGWPVAVGGSQAIADALLSYYRSLGGKVETSSWVKDVNQLPKHTVLMLDITPKQLLAIKGVDLSAGYRRQLERYRQGMGVFKIDWALSEPAPFKDVEVQKAGTVHLGGTFEEIANYERLSHRGEIVDRPFVLYAQQSVFDKSRAPDGRHTGWAYCHVPNGIDYDYTEYIERQVERFAPGFRDTILARHTFSASQMEVYNPNYVGGDINGGIMDIRQLYTRPVFSLTPYRTSNRKVYLCSSSTPPGGGVHGMCGFQAAKVVLKDHYGISINLNL